MIKKLKSINISLRFFITCVTIIVGGVMLWLYSFMSDRAYQNKYRDKLISDVKQETNILINQIADNNYKVKGKKNLEAGINTMASILNGRVIVVDSEYRILKDTFVSGDNGYIVNKDVMEIVNGGEVSLKEYEDYLEYMVPIKDEDDVKAVIVVLASTEQISRITDQLSRSNIMLYVLIMSVFSVAAYFFGKVTVRGINYINQQMEMNRNGHFDEPIAKRGFIEFQDLIQSYNSTIERLMVVDSARQEFVSNVSHELKTPITSMKVLADSLVENPDANLDMYKEFMTDIGEEIDRETKIINDLLTLVKMDKKSAQLSIEELDIDNLIQVIIKRVSPIAQSRGIDISYECFKEVIAEVDEVKLSLALSNIIENAVKYNVDNGWVKVTLNSDHKYFYVKVADSGVGIPDDCKELVFDRFYRVDKARSRDTGGTGLGLAITKNAVVMHKGNIKLYSESGEGTTFTIKIPLKHMENQNEKNN